jgi:teichuronic acid exporter
MSLKKQALSGVFWSSMQLFGNRFIGFGVSMVLARLLLPSEFGLMAMLSIFIGLGSALINSGLTQSIIRTENLDDEDFSTVFFFNLGGSIVIYSIIYIVAPYIADFYNQELLTSIVRVYCIVFIINAFSAIQITRLTKMMDFKTQLKVSLPSLIIGGSVGITMAYNDYGVWSLVWSNIIQTIAGTLQLWFWSQWRPSWVFNRKKFNYHFNYGVKLMLSGILNLIFTNAYTIIIGKFFAPAQVGFYNRAQTLQMLPVKSVISIVTKVSFPLFSSIQNDDVRLKSIYKRIMQMVVFLVTPTLILMAVLGEPLFRLLYTEKWLSAVPYFQILCVTGILYPINSYNLQILNVKGRSDLFLKLAIFKKIIVVVVILVSFQFGIYGLLYGSVLTSVIAFFINTHYSGKFLNYPAMEQTKDLLPIICLGILTGAVVYFLDINFTQAIPNDFFRLVLGGSSGVAFYVAAAYLFKMNSLTELIHIIQRK